MSKIMYVSSQVNASTLLQANNIPLKLIWNIDYIYKYLHKYHEGKRKVYLEITVKLFWF